MPSQLQKNQSMASHYPMFQVSARKSKVLRGNPLDIKRWYMLPKPCPWALSHPPVTTLLKRFPAEVAWWPAKRICFPAGLDFQNIPRQVSVAFPAENITIVHSGKKLPLLWSGFVICDKLAKYSSPLKIDDLGIFPAVFSMPSGVVSGGCGHDQRAFPEIAFQANLKGAVTKNISRRLLPDPLPKFRLTSLTFKLGSVKVFTGSAPVAPLRSAPPIL